MNAVVLAIGALLGGFGLGTLITLRVTRRPATPRTPTKSREAQPLGPVTPYRRGKAPAKRTGPNGTAVIPIRTPKPPPAATFPERPVGVPRHHIEASPLARRWEQ